MKIIAYDVNGNKADRRIHQCSYGCGCSGIQWHVVCGHIIIMVLNLLIRDLNGYLFLKSMSIYTIIPVKE